MGYSKFIQQLCKGIEDKITAYSRWDKEEGCLIYLRHPVQKIFVPADLIESKRDEVIQALREKIREGINETGLLILRDGEDGIVFVQEADG